MKDKTIFLIAAPEIVWMKCRFGCGWFSHHDYGCPSGKDCCCGVLAWEQRHFVKAIWQSFALPISRLGERTHSALARKYQTWKSPVFRALFLGCYRALFGYSETQKFRRTAMVWRGVERTIARRAKSNE